LVKILIEEGADVNGQDKNGATALMYAGMYYLFFLFNIKYIFFIL